MAKVELSTGRVIRQRRDTDGSGRFIKKQRDQHTAPFKKSNNPYMKSAFDDAEEYFLTGLGKQFVHYVMNEIVPRIESLRVAFPAACGVTDGG
jgi:hypothetical protein